jgi:hypothetical protein
LFSEIIFKKAKQMKIYFGSQEKDSVLDTDGMFQTESEPDFCFYYGLEFGSNAGGTNEVVIFDGCERTIPVDIESVPTLIEALQRCYDMHQQLEHAEQLKLNLEDDNYEESIIFDDE